MSFTANGNLVRKPAFICKAIQWCVKSPTRTRPRGNYSPTPIIVRGALCPAVVPTYAGEVKNLVNEFHVNFLWYLQAIEGLKKIALSKLFIASPKRRWF